MLIVEDAMSWNPKTDDTSLFTSLVYIGGSHTGVLGWIT